jgi:hypothetical protein
MPALALSVSDGVHLETDADHGGGGGRTAARKSLSVTARVRAVGGQAPAAADENRSR